MSPARRVSKKRLQLEIEHFADFSEHNYAKIIALIAEAKEKNMLPEVSEAIFKARTCMRILSILKDSLRGVFVKRLESRHRIN